MRQQQQRAHSASTAALLREQGEEEESGSSPASSRLDDATRTPCVLVRDAQLPSADDVEYWTAPAMEGWLQSQGDHIKSWRKRWFVLKQGYLFR